MKRDLLSVPDLTPDEIAAVLRRAGEFKSGARATPLSGKVVALLFEKPSLRTRTSFQVGIHKLGGTSFFFGKDEVGLGTREPIADVARVLSRMVDGVVARVFSHNSLEEFARHATVPVVNALSDWEHPCQALADVLTIQERFGGVKGRTVTYIGDGNNCARSLGLAVAALGGTFRCASPEGYELDAATCDEMRRLGGPDAASLHRDPREAAKGADALYTDVWTSMGQEAETAARKKAFAGYLIDDSMMKLAAPNAVLLHPMPAHPGEEVADGMFDHPRSAVFDETENRLWAQMAALELLFTAK